MLHIFHSGIASSPGHTPPLFRGGVWPGDEANSGITGKTFREKSNISEVEMQFMPSVSVLAFDVKSLTSTSSVSRRRQVSHVDV